MLAALSLLLAVPVLLRGGESVPLDGWIRQSSPSLAVVTDLDAAAASRLLTTLQGLRLAVVGLVLDQRDDSAVPTTLIVPAADDVYATFRLAGREGQFFPTWFEHLVIVNGDSQRRPLGLTAAHEYVHSLVAESGRALPLWLHEGLAEYYSSFRLVGDGAEVGRAVPGHRARLRGRALLSLDELHAVNDRSPEYHGDDGGRFYAQAWLTVHYLLSDVDRVRRLVRFVEALENGEAPTTAWIGAFDSKPESLKRRLRLYLNRRTLPSFVVSLPPRPSSGTPRQTTLSEGEVARLLGLVAVEQGRWGGSADRFSLARELFERSLHLAPEDGDTHAALGRLEASLERWGAAERTFEKAVYLDALEPRSYAYYADYLLRRSERADSASWILPRAVEMLQRALDLGPPHGRLERQLEDLLAAGETPPAR